MIVFVWVWWRERRLPWSLILACALSLVPYLLFRVWYYADFFPNTYYLKDISWYRQGLRFLFDTVLVYQLVPYLLLAGVGYLLLRSQGREGGLRIIDRLMMIALALSVMFYVIKIGGDARHFRYLAFPFCMLVFATGDTQYFVTGRIPFNPNTKTARVRASSFCCISRITTSYLTPA